jgi:RNA polymerase sigma-70 factor (ECF subfamily)
MVDPLLDLVERAQLGDQAAFAEIVEATHRDVYRVAFQVLRDAQEAEDLTQDVYLRVWRALATFKGQARFRTWLCRVTLNTCLNRRRALRTQLRLVEANDETLGEASSGWDDPHTAVVTQEGHQVIREAVARLPDKYRLVIGLFYQQQLGYQEISELLALPLGTVKAHLNRARKALARYLGAREGDTDADL